ncbi:MAG TPA: 3D domain-containing protein [Fimbriimonadaceae bacterium]|nr:3D domain-containing protein [Fimbriimonadaceae bacterium]
MAPAGREQDRSKKSDIKVEKKSIQPKVTYEFDRNVGRGRLVKAQDGAPGAVKRTYQVIYKNGKPVGKELIKEEVSLPRDKTYLMSRDGYPTSRGSFTRTRILTMVATAYTDSPWENGGSTRASLGVPLRDGVVAVDPRIIPLGTKLYIEGYGFAYACDTGSAIKGNRIDLLLSSSAACSEWGRRVVKVHVLTAARD